MVKVVDAAGTKLGNQGDCMLLEIQDTQGLWFIGKSVCHDVPAKPFILTAGQQIVVRRSSAYIETESWTISVGFQPDLSLVRAGHKRHYRSSGRTPVALPLP